MPPTRSRKTAQKVKARNTKRFTPENKFQGIVKIEEVDLGIFGLPDFEQGTDENIPIPPEEQKDVDTDIPNLLPENVTAGVSQPLQSNVQPPIVKKTGFGKNLLPKEIVFAGLQANELQYLMKWHGSSEMDLVSSNEAQAKCPELLINFLEKRLRMELFRGKPEWIQSMKLS